MTIIYQSFGICVLFIVDLKNGFYTLSKSRLCKMNEKSFFKVKHEKFILPLMPLTCVSAQIATFDYILIDGIVYFLSEEHVKVIDAGVSTI